MKKCLIIANGNPPSKKIINYLITKNYNTIFCADGGYDTAIKLKIIPDFVIGDFDSIKQNGLKQNLSKPIFIKLNRQNDTDVEKCLKIAIKKKYNEAILLGATGLRLDHTICNLGIVLKFFDKIKIKILSENSLLTPFKDEVKLKTKVDEIISIYAFDNITSITSNGLKYPLRNTKLPFGIKESTSNRATKDEVNLSIKNGIAFVVRNFETTRKNVHF